MVAPIAVTHITDPGCPWAWSASPALAVLRWRYREGLRWRLVMIGLAEAREQYERRGYGPDAMALGYRHFRDAYGMPFATRPRTRVLATAPACRAVVAARAQSHELGEAALRALQVAWFTSPALLDEPDALLEALSGVAGLDAAEVVRALEDPEVVGAYERDREEARSASGSPAARQGKTAKTDGPERYTAPTLVFARDGLALQAGGFQPVEAYDALVVNLDPGLTRHPPPDGPRPALEVLGPLTTQEVAAVLAEGNARPDRRAAEDALIGLEVAGRVARTPVGDDALWAAAG